MKTCAHCIHWHRLGFSAQSRTVLYDNRAILIPPGEEGQCRALPPLADRRWPLSMAGDWCGCWRAQPSFAAGTTGAVSAESPPAATPGGAPTIPTTGGAKLRARGGETGRPAASVFPTLRVES